MEYLQEIAELFADYHQDELDDLHLAVIHQLIEADIVSWTDQGYLHYGL